MGNDVNENDPTPEQVRKAIVALATRVSDLEKVSVAGVPVGDAGDLQPVMAATLAKLKTLRTTLTTCNSEFDDLMKRCSSLREENAKLRYQIKHLKRSLTAAEES